MPGDDNALFSEQMIVGVMCNSITVISDLVKIQPDKRSGLQPGYIGIQTLEYCLSISRYTQTQHFANLRKPDCISPIENPRKSKRSIPITDASLCLLSEGENDLLVTIQKNA